MKQTSLFLTLLIASFSLMSQPWLDDYFKTKQPGDISDMTLFDHQKAFNDYCNKLQVKNGYYLSPETGEETKMRGYKQFKRWEWRMLSQVNPLTGEFPEKTTYEAYQDYLAQNPAPEHASSNWTNVGIPYAQFTSHSGAGRINCIAFHPTNVNTYWVGTSAGGLWRTNDGGNSWQPLTDFIGSLGISDILVDPDYDNNGILLIATGDKDMWTHSHSIGILKSTDGGLTWNQTNVQYTTKEGKNIYRMLMDPQNSQIMIAATDNGVYRSVNGGNDWTLQSTLRLIDMEYKPGDFNTIYGSTANSFCISHNAGLNWTLVQTINDSRIELATSPDQPNWVYAVDATGRIHKSEDSGMSYNQIFSNNPVTIYSGQAWYDLGIAVDPFDANNVFVGVVSRYESTNGGLSWTYHGSFTHVDIHMLLFHPNGDLYECNDGGLYIKPKGEYFFGAINTSGVVNTEFYRIGLSPSDPQKMMGGTQDNGSFQKHGTDWRHVLGGDGMECIIDPSDENIQYAETQNGGMHRTNNNWAYSSYIKPSGSQSGSWITPYVLHPQIPSTIFAGFLGQLYKSTNRGDTWTKLIDNFPDYITSIAIAASNPSIMYISSSFSIWKSTDGGMTWTDLSANRNFFNSIEYLTVKHDDPNTVWVALSSFDSNGIYESTDGGLSWTNISQGLPEVPMLCVIENKLSNTTTDIYACGNTGVYLKSGSNNWVPYTKNLPTVEVHEIEIFYNGSQSKLVAGTYGRGIWESPLKPASDELYVNAGNDFSYELSDSLAKLNASASGGTPPYVMQWTQVSGPSAAGILNPNALSTKLNNLVVGDYLFAIHLTDGVGDSVSDRVWLKVLPKHVDVSGVTLDKTQATMRVGETLQLHETVLPADASNKNVTWKSSNTAVAQVSVDGLVTAQATGNAIITVTTEEHGFTAKCTVQVVHSYAELNIPGTVEAEYFDHGGQLTAYYDTDPGNNGGEFRSESVDIEVCSNGGFNVGWTVHGEWINYTIASIQAGVYTISFLTASESPAGGASITALLDGQPIALVNPSNTGGWQIWETRSVKNVVLAEGQNKVLQLIMTGGNFNVDKMVFTRQQNRAPVANAGSDIQITLPTNMASLDGSQSYDPDQDPLTYAWKQISGPDTALIANPNHATTGISGLTKGEYIFQLTVDDGELHDSDFVKVTVKSDVQEPFASQHIPGTVEAENYDLGGQNIAYFDDDAGNTGGAYRNDHVDIEPTNSGGFNVGWIRHGEWLEYTIETVKAGKYNIQIPTASAGPWGGSAITLSIDGSVLGTVHPGNTGGWQNWKTLTLENVSIAAGSNRLLRLDLAGGDYNIDRVKFTLQGNKPPVAIAGADILLTWPASTTTLDGSQSYDPDQDPITYSWLQTSGPNAATIHTPNAATTNISGLIEGVYVFELTVDDGKAKAVDTVVVTVGKDIQTAFTVQHIPGTVEAENYDNGGQGIAYSDNEQGNTGGAYRQDDVDIEPCDKGGFNVGWIRNGEWLEYTIATVQPGLYNIYLELASAGPWGGSMITLKLDGTVIGVIHPSNTGGWQNWTTQVQNSISLLGGNNRLLRIELAGGDYNINKIDFVKIGNQPERDSEHEFSLTENTLDEDIITGLNSGQEAGTHRAVRSWPNPVHDYLNIDFNGQTFQQLMVLDFSGKEIYRLGLDQLQESQVKLEMNAFSKGVYLVKLNGIDGHTQTIKVIK